MTDLQFNTLDAITEKHAQRLDKELYAAWRAGYDYLYVLSEMGDDYRLRVAYFPANYRGHSFPEYDVSVYDLRAEQLTQEARRSLYDYRL